MDYEVFSNVRKKNSRSPKIIRARCIQGEEWTKYLKVKYASIAQGCI